MKVVDRKPVPIYEAKCSECHSKIEYKASEVSFTGYITCPVCGMSVWGSTCYPVRMDSEESGEPSILLIESLPFSHIRKASRKQCTDPTAEQ